MQIILAVMFVLAGSPKVFGVKMQVDNFNEYGYPQWFRTTTGFVESFGAALLIAGVWTSSIAIAGGSLLAVTMLAAGYIHITRAHR